MDSGTADWQPAPAVDRSTARIAVPLMRSDETLSEALARFGKPEIFNSDQGSQFTSEEFTRVLLDHRIAISMDCRGRCHDNIFVGAAVVDGEARVGVTASGGQRT
jgi:transposase InsO family protein